MPGNDAEKVVITSYSIHYTKLYEAGDRTPVIFLTARDSSGDTVQGLGLGADDYLAKPFALEELVARVEAVLRRIGGSAEAADVLTLADLTIDDVAHRVTRGSTEIHLSPTEYKLVSRITSYNVCYTKLLRADWGRCLLRYPAHRPGVGTALSRSHPVSE